MNQFEMIAFIVLVVVLGKVITQMFRGRQRGGPTAAEASENARLKSEMQQLKDRIATLERLAVDKRQRLADEIDALGRD